MNVQIMHIVIGLLSGLVILLTLRILKLSKAITKLNNYISESIVGNLVIVYPPKNYDERPYMQLEIDQESISKLETDSSVRLSIERVYPTVSDIRSAKKTEPLMKP